MKYYGLVFDVLGVDGRVFFWFGKARYREGGVLFAFSIFGGMSRGRKGGWYFIVGVRGGGGSLRKGFGGRGWWVCFRGK